MEAFINFVKQRHILEDFKGTFDTSSKFKYPQPSEQQKRKFFEEEFNQIITKFYAYMKETGVFNANPNKQYDPTNRNIDQSLMIVQFDTWLQLEENVFTYVEVEKPKTNTSQPMYAYSATNSINQTVNNKYSNPQAGRVPQTKPYLAEKQLQSPAIKGVTISNPYIPMFQPAPANYHPSTHHQAPTVVPHTPHQQHKQIVYHAPVVQERVQQKQKPYRLRFIQKLSQFLDCPQRYTITKSELSSLTISRK